MHAKQRVTSNYPSGKARGAKQRPPMDWPMETPPSTAVHVVRSWLAGESGSAQLHPERQLATFVCFGSVGRRRIYAAPLLPSGSKELYVWVVFWSGLTRCQPRLDGVWWEILNGNPRRKKDKDESLCFVWLELNMATF